MKCKGCCEVIEVACIDDCLGVATCPARHKMQTGQKAGSRKTFSPGLLEGVTMAEENGALTLKYFQAGNPAPAIDSLDQATY